MAGTLSASTSPDAVRAERGATRPPELHVRVLRADGAPLDAGPESAPFRAGVTLTTASATSGAAWDAAVEVAYGGATEVDAAVCLSVEIGPPVRPLWLIPGIFYGENRPPACRRLYPRFDASSEDEARFVSSAWAFRADRAATPVVFGWDAEHCVGLSTAPHGPLGLPALGFGVEPDGRGELRLFFPYRDTPVTYDGSETPAPPDVQLHHWRPGERVGLRATIHVAASEPHAYAPVLRDLHARLVTAAPLAAWVSPAAAARLAAEGLVRWHYRERDAALLETAAFERDGAAAGDAPGDRHAMHVAWLSGAPAAYALLAHGRAYDDDAAMAAGERVLDNIATHLAPCGTFWGQWSAAHGWGKGWTPGDDRLHARTLGEATLFMVRAAATESRRGVHRAVWRGAVASNLAFVARVARPDGALGSAYHGRTGTVESWDGAAGMAWIPALVEGARVLDSPDLVEVARRAGTFYARFVDAEFINGAPEDVDLAPTSEDGYVAVMAYVALAEAAANDEDRARWLDLARRAADWTLSFRYAWNVAFPRHTLLDVYDFRTRGGDQASVANQHLHAYGLICLPEMARLSTVLGDPWYAERTRENLACFRQFIARVDGDFNACRGMAPERYYQTACFGPKGGIGALSHAWCLGLLLYGCDEAASIDGLEEATDRARSTDAV